MKPGSEHDASVQLMKQIPLGSGGSQSHVISKVPESPAGATVAEVGDT